MKLPSLLMAEKIEPKILLMDKAVVTLLIRSFLMMPSLGMVNDVASEVIMDLGEAIRITRQRAFYTHRI